MSDRLRLFLVHPDPKDHREGVRAVGLRAEPRPDGQKLAPGDRRAPRRHSRPGEAFMEKGEDFIVEDELPALVRRMNALTGASRCSISPSSSARSTPATGSSTIRSPRTCRSPPCAARAAYLGDRLIRTAKPHKMLDPANGPLIAVRLNILTRKTLGGLQTDLDGRVLGADGEPLAGPVCGGRSRRFRRRRHAWLSRRWKARSSAAASFPGAALAGRRPPRLAESNPALLERYPLYAYHPPVTCRPPRCEPFSISCRRSRERSDRRRRVEHRCGRNSRKNCEFESCPTQLHQAIEQME